MYAEKSARRSDCMHGRSFRVSTRDKLKILEIVLVGVIGSSLGGSSRRYNGKRARCTCLQILTLLWRQDGVARRADAAIAV